MSSIVMGPAQVIVKLADNTQIEMSASRLQLDTEEEVLEHVSGFDSQTRRVVTGRRTSVTFDVDTFDVVQEPEKHLPEIEQVLKLIRVIRF